MKKDEFKQLQIGDSVYGTLHVKGEITLIEFTVTDKTENEILVKTKNTSNSLIILNKNDLLKIEPFKYKLLFTNKNDAINKALESLKDNQRKLTALLD